MLGSDVIGQRWIIGIIPNPNGVSEVDISFVYKFLGLHQSTAYCDYVFATQYLQKHGSSGGSGYFSQLLSFKSVR